MSRPTIRSTYQNRPASVPLMSAGIGASVVTLVLTVALLGGLSIWWFYVRTNTVAEIRQDGFNFQQAANDRVIDLNGELTSIDVQLSEPDATDAQKQALNAQRLAIATQLCDAANDINNPTATIGQIIAKEC